MHRLPATVPLAIISAAMALTICWVFIVPIFQSPDEDMHADYIFCLYSRKKLIQGREAPIAGTSHPFIFYLLKMTNGQTIKWNSFVKAPNDYGTKQFFAKIDHEAPNIDTNTKVDTNPAMMAVYPVEYYALVALWLTFLSQFTHSLSFLFFAARLFSVLLLGCGLTFSYLTMLNLGLSYKQSCLVLATIAFFPLTSFIGSYIQPDNLSFAVLGACFYFALEWYNCPNKNAMFKLSLAMAALLLCKYQFFCCAAIAIIILLISKTTYLRFSFRKIMNAIVLLFSPSAIAAVLQLWISWDCNLPPINNKQWHWFAVTTEFQRVWSQHDINFLIKYIWKALKEACQNIYSMDGFGFQTFWGNFGWIDTPLIIGSTQINDIVSRIIELLTICTIFLTLASIVRITIRLIRMAQKGKWRRAFLILGANPVINTYLVFVLFFFCFYVVTYPSFTGQGRHWWPLLLGIVLSTAILAPLISPNKTIRRTSFYVIVISWLSYSLAGSYYALPCLYKRYYQVEKQAKINPEQLLAVPIFASCSIDMFDFIDEGFTFKKHSKDPLSVPAGKNIEVLGWAIDFANQAPASAVYIYIDNDLKQRAIYGLESSGATSLLQENAYKYTGFAAVIPTEGLEPGPHMLTIKVASKDSRLLYGTDQKKRFVIVPK